MKKSEKKQAIDDLYAELSRVMLEYAACVKRDDFFEIKRKWLGRARELEKEIEDLKVQQSEEQLENNAGKFFFSGKEDIPHDFAHIDSKPGRMP